MAQSAGIPVVDLTALDSAQPDERQACAAEIGRALREVGFFYALGHSIEAALVARVFGVARDFFALPLEEKLAVRMRPETGYRGYFPLQGEVTDEALGGDPKEGFDIAVSPPRMPEGESLAEIPWPRRPESLEAVLGAYHAALCDLGRRISRGFALALDLPEAFFAERLQRPTAILRILHYPESGGLRDAESGEAVSCGAHSDYGYLTILAQDEEGGLQVQDRAGRWIDVPPRAGAFVCNIGELMGRWTNDVFRATPHRVLRVSRAPRYSVPFFFHPDDDVLVETLPTCIAEDRPAHYLPVTSGDYVLQRQRGAYG